MQYAIFSWRNASRISRTAIPGLVVRLTILTVILLVAACKHDDSGSNSGSNKPPPTFTESSNADLAGLSIHGSLDQPFSAERYDYTATVAYRFKSLQVTPATADENASVTVNGVTLRSGFASSSIDHSPGVNSPILIEVISEDKKETKVYRLVLTVQAPSTNADLASIIISIGSFAPVFDPANTAYTVSVDFSTTTVQLNAEVNHSRASLTVNGIPLPFNQIMDPTLLVPGDNNITFQVTAEDGVSTKNYELVVNRDRGDNANLADLRLSAGLLNSIFQPYITDYTASVGFVDTMVQVTAITEAAGASVSINNTAVVSGGASQPIPLGEGSNLVAIITVRAENGFTTQSYTLLVERQSTNEFLQQAYLKASNTGSSD